jgi:hypothetical protein
MAQWISMLYESRARFMLNIAHLDLIDLTLVLVTLFLHFQKSFQHETIVERDKVVIEII